MRRTVGTALAQEPALYRVDDLTIDVGRRQVMRENIEVPLPPLSFDLLLAVASAAPNVLSHDQLLARVWPGIVVNLETVGQRVKLVRDALGDDPHNPRYIAGVRGRGYRMIPPVVRLASPDLMPEHPTEPGVPREPGIDARVALSNARVLWRRVAAAAIGAIVLLTAIGAGIMQFRDRISRSNAALTMSVTERAPRSIAVLPFVNISDDPENEYFSDGLTEELLNRLTTVPELHVAARTSSFHFKGKAENVKRIGEALGVQHVLEGSVRKEGDRIRVAAQLVNSETGFRLWSSAFERQATDVFAIQDEIAHAVAENLELTLVANERATPARRLSNHPQALDLYLRGRHLYQSWQPARIEKGIEYFKKAIRIDPGFVAAYVAQSEAQFARSLRLSECCEARRANLRERRELLRRAIELDPNNADAIASLGRDLLHEWDFAGAERELRRAERINPNGELVLRYFTWYYMTAGWPPERAVGYARRLFRLDPLNSFAALGVVQALYSAHQYEQALRAADRVIELDPSYWPGHTFRSASLQDLGRYEEALESAQRALALSGDDPVRYLDVIWSYAGLGETQEARKLYDQFRAPDGKKSWSSAAEASLLAAMGRFEEAMARLEQAYEDRDEELPSILNYKAVIPLHANPRFQKIVRQLKLERRIQHTREMNGIRERIVWSG